MIHSLDAAVARFFDVEHSHMDRYKRLSTLFATDDSNQGLVLSFRRFTTHREACVNALVDMGSNIIDKVDSMLGMIVIEEEPTCTDDELPWCIAVFMYVALKTKVLQSWIKLSMTHLEFESASVTKAIPSTTDAYALVNTSLQTLKQWMNYLETVFPDDQFGCGFESTARDTAWGESMVYLLTQDAPFPDGIFDISVVLSDFSEEESDSDEEESDEDDSSQSDSSANDWSDDEEYDHIVESEEEDSSASEEESEEQSVDSDEIEYIESDEDDDDFDARADKKPKLK